MRNSDSSNSSGRRGGAGRKNSNRNSNSRSRSGSNQQPRSQNAKSARNKQATELWLSPSSQTLTSHIGIVSRSKDENNNGGSKKKDQRNGQASANGSGNASRNRSRNAGDKPRHNKHNNPKNRNQNAANGNGSRNGATPAPRAESAPRSSGSGDREKLVANIEPFELFCAYHLGITQDNNFKPANINEVARRFRSDPATIRQALKEYDMDSQSLLDRDFDMALGQLDIQVCPEGVDRGEIAKTIYAEFLDAPRVERDWKKILEEDRKENQKIFKS